jgi:predicted unusual protein kinase regulating ubiquinone biosynthesis (AarF/ABC1/UbiB family)
MGWLEGRRILEFIEAPLDDRNRIATAMFRAWWNPFARFGVIHGDPHLGNYTVFEETVKKGAGLRPAGINLLDFGCIRIFPPRFVAGVIDLYEGLRASDRARIVHAYEGWGFRNLGNEMIDALNVWARFIYAPLLDDRVRTIADGVAPHAYGRREAWEVKQKLKPLGSVLIPREFVLMDRAAVGLGSVMLHLKAELNFHRLFAEAVQDFSEAKLAAAQQKALKAVGLE